MEQNKTGKYLKYAIGEIILVVFGILIALNINNWNENKKLVVKEIKILKEIQTELSVALLDLNGDIEDHERNLEFTQKVNRSLLLGEPYHDSITRQFLYALDREQLTAKLSAFESLKSMGLEIISNDSIRQSITTTYLYIENFVNNVNKVDKSINDLEVLLAKYLIIDRARIDSDSSLIYARTGSKNLPFKINNYNALLKDEQVLITLMRSIKWRYGQINGSKTLKNNIQIIIADIEKELKAI